MKKTLNTSHKGNIWCGLACGAILAFSPNLHAQTDALQGYSGGMQIIWAASTGYTLGWQFQANQDISVTALGVYELNPWSTDHEVGLWDDSNQQLLADVTVASSDPESQDSNGNEIRWVTLSTPLDLSAGLTYAIAAYYPASGGTIHDNFQELCSSVTTDPDITYVQSVRTLNDEPFTFPDTANESENGTAFFGPNFQFTSAPEPSTSALFGIGFIALFGLQRYHAKRKA